MADIERKPSLHFLGTSTLKGNAMDKPRLRSTLKKLKDVKFGADPIDDLMAPQEMLDFVAMLDGQKPGWNPTEKRFRAATNRFDDPDRSFGVLYAAADRDGAFAESVGRKPGIFRTNDELSKLAMTDLALTKELRLVDLHGGEAVGAVGATGVVGVGPQSLARRWAKALHAHPEAPDGIEYRCRHNSDELAVALFHRIGDASLERVSVTSLVSDVAWLAAMRARHRIMEPPG